MWLYILVLCFSVLVSAVEGVNLTATVCDGTWMLLGCPVPMTVISANYGRLDKTTCPAGNAIGSAPLNTTTCSAANSLTYMTNQCTGQVYCSPHATTSSFGGDPCNGTAKYLTVTYSCPDPSMVINTKVACEGSVMSLQCATGYIDILSWNYGRLDNYTCPAGNAIGSANLSNTNCITTSNPFSINLGCDRTRNCSIAVTSASFGGDPCVGIAKYLTVTFSCINVGKEVACENTTLKLQCAFGVVRILRASYGRTDVSTCGPHYFINCMANVVTIVGNVCNGQQNCSIEASTTVLGNDPCPAGVRKYLSVIYYCQVITTTTTSTKSLSTTTASTGSTSTATTINATSSSTTTKPSTTSTSTSTTTTRTTTSSTTTRPPTTSTSTSTTTTPTTSSTTATPSTVKTTSSTATSQSASLAIKSASSTVSFADTSTVAPSTTPVVSVESSSFGTTTIESELVTSTATVATNNPVAVASYLSGPEWIKWLLGAAVATTGIIFVGSGCFIIASYCKRKRPSHSQ